MCRVDTPSLWCEAGLLLADRVPGLDLTLVGPLVPQERTEQSDTLAAGNVQLRYAHGLYNELYDRLCESQGGAPDVVVAMNCAVSTDERWRDTLMLLAARKQATVFSDYGGSQAEMTRLNFEPLGVPLSVEPQLNPFRSPVRVTWRTHALPWYENAYLYAICVPAASQPL